MVRTLDFQSKNVGSIPSNPVIISNGNTRLFFKKKNTDYSSNSVFFDLFFASFIAPNFIKNFTLNSPVNTNLHKIQIKQSYIIFTWFYHMATFQKKRKSVKFFVMPLRKKKMTQIKAPIAHKN